MTSSSHPVPLAQTPSHARLHGLIVNRRSMGRNLAFVDVRSDGGETDVFPSSDEEVIPVAFRCSSFLGTNFPIKNAHLPYGALVDMSLQESGKPSGPRWEVVSWTMSQMDAEDLAKDVDGGVCCSKYLQIRSESYLKVAGYNPNTTLERRSGPASDPKTLGGRSGPTSEHDATDKKDNSQAKALRAKIFASWLLEGVVSSDDRVLDVAGGKGELSMQLALTAGVRCTVVDPVVRKRLKRQVKQLIKHSKPVPEFRCHAFRAGEAKTANVLHSHSCLVGLHPDEPTEDIVDLALAHNKGFAVVPCCVFPSFFPHRQLPSGEFVQTYEQFLDYLVLKDDRIQRATLPLEGKNQVVYLKVRKDAESGFGHDTSGVK